LASADRFGKVTIDSLKLLDLGRHEEAFRLLDDSIAEAIKEGEREWVSILCHHATVLCTQRHDLPLRKHYFERSLVSNPEDPMALYGLADAALEEGQPDIAKQLAQRCYRAIMRVDNELVKKGLLDLVLKSWPEVDQ
jgi:tetratricopeptide (TPR) repeat protein